MNGTPQKRVSGFYIRHKGLIINFSSVLFFLGFNSLLGDEGINKLPEAPLLALIYVLVFALEPWATSYSMGAFNQRRKQAGIDLIALHALLRAGFLAVVFWASRTAINGLLLLASFEALITWEELKNPAFAPFFFIGIMIREGFVVYNMSSEKPKPDFKESYDFIADLILFLSLTFGQMVVAEAFKDLGAKNVSTLAEIGLYLFPILLFFFLFYLPVRYIYTVEDFTFARTKWQKAEQFLSFFVLFLGFLLAS